MDTGAGGDGSSGFGISDSTFGDMLEAPVTRPRASRVVHLGDTTPPPATGTEAAAPADGDDHAALFKTWRVEEGRTADAPTTSTPPKRADARPANSNSSHSHHQPLSTVTVTPEKGLTITSVHGSGNASLGLSDMSVQRCHSGLASMSHEDVMNLSTLAETVPQSSAPPGAPPGILHSVSIEEDMDAAAGRRSPQHVESEEDDAVAGPTRGWSRTSSMADPNADTIRSADNDDERASGSAFRSLFRKATPAPTTPVKREGFKVLNVSERKLHRSESTGVRRPYGAAMHSQHSDPMRWSGGFTAGEHAASECTTSFSNCSPTSRGVDDASEASSRFSPQRGLRNFFFGGGNKRESLNLSNVSQSQSPSQPHTPLDGGGRMSPRAGEAPAVGTTPNGGERSALAATTSNVTPVTPGDANDDLKPMDGLNATFTHLTAGHGLDASMRISGSSYSFADDGKRGSIQPPPPGSEATHAGWLEKKGAGGLIKMFRRRWFEIHREHLYYFQGEGDRVVGRICLADPDVRAAPVDVEGKNHAFELSGRSLPRTYELAADTEEERNEWVQKITKTVNWCSVASAEEMQDWLEGLLPSTTRMTINDFHLQRVVGTGSFANVVRVTLKDDSAMNISEARTRWLTEHLMAFYQKHRPDRVRGVDVLVKRCPAGGERELHKKLVERFPQGEEDLRWLLDSPPVESAGTGDKAGENMDNVFAMKVIKKSALPSIKVARMMMEEKAILQSMKHPYIVRLHYAFQTDTKLYLVLTYLSGKDLRHHLNANRKLDEARARFYCAQILLALDHLHSHGIVYRDLKPQNVVLDHNGHAVLTDLGLATDITDTGRAYTFCGTPQYVAPEVLQGQAYSKAVDFWALGVCMYEMLVGATPFQGGDSLQDMFLRIMEESIRFPSVVSKPAREFVTACLERDMDKRLCTLSACKTWKLFKGISWQDLRNRRVPAPWVPPAEVIPSDALDGATALDLTDLIPEMVKPVIEDQFEGFTYMEGSPVVQKPVARGEV